MRQLGLLLIVACAAPAERPAPPSAHPTAAPPALPAPPPPALPAPPVRPPARPAAEPGPTAAEAAAAPASCVDDGPLYDAGGVRAAVTQLAGPALDGRAPGSDGDRAARRYIVDQFRCLGLRPAGADGGYEQPFSADGHPTANLLGYLPGEGPTAADIIVVGAHHDHLGDGHPGANDNASGVAALLAIARAVRRHDAPGRTIAFFAFGGEELGLLGSAALAAHPPDALPLARVVYDVNLDMVGSYRAAGAVYAMGTFRGLPATPIVAALAAERPRLHVATGGRGVGSDHEAFCAAGVPYVFFWTPDRRCYHARCDTLDRLDVDHLAEIAGLAGGLVERLAASPADLAGSRAQLGCTGRRG